MAAVTKDGKIYILSDNQYHEILLPDDTLAWDCNGDGLAIATIDKITINNEFVIENDNTDIISLIMCGSYNAVGCIFHDRIEIVYNQQKQIYEFEFTEHLRNYKYFCDFGFSFQRNTNSNNRIIPLWITMCDYTYTFVNGQITKELTKNTCLDNPRYIHYVDPYGIHNNCPKGIICKQADYNVNHNSLIIYMGKLSRYLGDSNFPKFDGSLVNNLISHTAMIYNNEYYVYIPWNGFQKLDKGYEPYIVTKKSTCIKSARK